MLSVAVIGLPSSAGSYAAGQDLAPAALRDAGLIQALSAQGLQVHDAGDLPRQVWRPDRTSPRAQNLDQVVSGLQVLAGSIESLLADSDRVLVLGGNCTIALSVMAALQRVTPRRPGLLYFDRQFDLNTPNSTTDGALDWMGMGHALALPNTVEALVTAFGSRPLLEPTDVPWLGVDASLATEWERMQAMTLGLNVTPSDRLADDPDVAVTAALATLPDGPLAMHVDVDVLDFTDVPLAENTDGRNSGPTLDQLQIALRCAARRPQLRVLSIGELNPTRSAGEPEALTRLLEVLAAILSTSEAYG